MKTKIDIRKIKAIIIELAILAFAFGGWVMFAFSEINRQKDMTREINRQTEEIMKDIHRKDSVLRSITLDTEFPR